MVKLAALEALLLYLAPLAALLVLRSRRDRPLWEIALDLPLAVALDLLVVHALARVLTLETAVLVSRPLWLAAAGTAAAVRLRRGWRPAWPAALGRRELAITLAAVVLAVGLSVVLSRAPYAAWDRRLHIPLVSSLRAQRIPFSNVFDPGIQLYYHFAGDVLAAELQTLSFAVIGSSHALSLAHDLVFGLIGASVALLLRGIGYRSLWVAPLGALAVLLEGPVTFLRPERRLTNGYSFTNWLTLSFRPHVSLAGLLYVGFVGAAFVRLRDRSWSTRVPASHTAPVLLACTAALAITDEGSLGLLGLALGAAWLVAPELLHEKRLPGLALLGGLLVALVLPNVAFGGALGPGAPKHAITLVPWRSPGYHNPPLALATLVGWNQLMWDLAPMLVVLAGGLLALFVVKSRALRVTFAFYAVLLAASILGLTRVEVGGEPLESHRFVTVAGFLAPMLALAWARLCTGPSPTGRSRAPLAVPVLLGGALLGPASTLEWLSQTAPGELHHFDHFWSREDHYALDCRADYGARLGETPREEYLAKAVYHGYSGCHPVWAPGRRVARQWDIKTESMIEHPALVEVDRLTPADQPLRMECPAGASDDPACVWAAAHGRCARIGKQAQRCDVPPPERKNLLRETTPAPPPAPPAKR
jgi:hypothetical protein